MILIFSINNYTSITDNLLNLGKPCLVLLQSNERDHRSSSVPEPLQDTYQSSDLTVLVVVVADVGEVLVFVVLILAVVVLVVVIVVLVCCSSCS